MFSLRVGLPKRPLRRFRGGGNGKPLPENGPTARFYTAWVDSGRTRPQSEH
jgi:hypothetical protein